MQRRGLQGAADASAWSPRSTWCSTLAKKGINGAGPQLRPRSHAPRRAVHRAQAPAADRTASSRTRRRSRTSSTRARARSSSPRSRTYDEDGDELDQQRAHDVRARRRRLGRRARPERATSTSPPDRAPDAVVEEKTSREPGAALSPLRRLEPAPRRSRLREGVRLRASRSSTACARSAIAARHVDQGVRATATRASSRASRCASRDSVFPGETLVTEMWKESDTKIVFRCKVKERDKVVHLQRGGRAVQGDPEARRTKAAGRSRGCGGAAAAASRPAPTSSARSATFVGDEPGDSPRRSKTTFLFKLTEPDGAWTIDLKNAPGAVTEGAAARPTCTLELSRRRLHGDGDRQGRRDEAVLDAASSRSRGDVMASQKLGFLKKIDAGDGARRDEEARRGGGAAAPRRPRAAPGATTRRPSATCSR